MLPEEVMEKGRFTDKRTVHGASHIVVLTGFPSSFGSNTRIIGDSFKQFLWNRGMRGKADTHMEKLVQRQQP